MNDIEEGKEYYLPVRACKLSYNKEFLTVEYKKDTFDLVETKSLIDPDTLKQPEPMSYKALLPICDKLENGFVSINAAIEQIQALGAVEVHCPYCKSPLLWSEDRGDHCDGCDEYEGQPAKEVQPMDRAKILQILKRNFHGVGNDFEGVVDEILALGVEQPDSYEVGEVVLKQSDENPDKWFEVTYLGAYHKVKLPEGLFNEYLKENQLRKLQPEPEQSEFEKFMKDNFPYVLRSSADWSFYKVTFEAGQQSKEAEK